MPTALIGLGSNLGARAAACARAASLIDRLPQTRLVALSRLVESAPIGGPPQRPFVNAVLRVETGIRPGPLLRKLKRIERDLGRVPGLRWGPRRIDADLLYWGEAVVRNGSLDLPHPRIAERRFVLDPLAEVAASFRDPVRGCTLEALRDRAAPEVRGQEVSVMKPVPRTWKFLGERIARRQSDGARRAPARILRTVAALRRYVAAARRAGRSIGFVPTMGALHEGHLSLMRRAKRECDVVLVSIFVNPMQFGPREDFSKYPRDLAGDARLCSSAGVDAIFAPSVEAMYPPGFKTCVDMRDLTEPLCGRFRPGHFRGVMTVVAKLFLQVQPDAAFFGQKDFQQAAILKQMARDLDFPIRIVRCPIVREPDGLAMSSRNAYLSPEERSQALCLSQALTEARRLLRGGERRAGRLRRAMKRIVRAVSGARIDYISIVDPETLRDVEQATPSSVALLAVRIGPARLIDNAILGE
ncbi:MAG: pantoate--beta-alanine ligase [Planctomycetes bacterium]|nr:pantoate--beta-alanine ligase [Planctomycetota bacterium]